jgi:succinate dehydrogenase / fumarate reductase flavoprotein subunit
MERYCADPAGPGPRDMVARSIMTEIGPARASAGIARSTTTYTWTPPTWAETLLNKLPDITDFCKTYLGVDPAEGPIPVLPTAHYAMGGIPTDTSRPGRG